MHVSPKLRGGLFVLGTLTGLGVLAHAAHVAFGVGSPGLDGLFQDWVLPAVSVGAGAMCVLRGVAIRRERVAWLLMGAGLLAWAGGDITWTAVLAEDPNPPYPSA